MEDKVYAELTEKDLSDRYGPVVFTFSRGSYFGGAREYSIRCRPGEEVGLVSVHGTNGDYVHGLNTITKNLFIEKIAKPVAALDWKERYESPFTILDGFCWAIDLDFGGYKLHSGGQDAKPKDYADVAESLEDTLCRMIAYGDELEGGRSLRAWLRKALGRIVGRARH